MGAKAWEAKAWEPRRGSRRESQGPTGSVWALRVTFGEGRKTFGTGFPLSGFLVLRVLFRRCFVWGVRRLLVAVALWLGLGLLALLGLLAFDVYLLDVFFVMSEIDIFVSSAGNFNFSTVDHVKKLTNNTFVGNTGHFDNDIDFAGSEGLEGMKVDIFKPKKILSSSPLATV